MQPQAYLAQAIAQVFLAIASAMLFAGASGVVLGTMQALAQQLSQVLDVVGRLRERLEEIVVGVETELW